ncbi:hypothetical protein Pelo_18718 [Pelomyxa schiedti]|nr:hypothetical protein Pelo_18718 [Pelomyxa schiedti]
MHRSGPVMPRIGMEVTAMARDQFIALAAPSFSTPSPPRRAVLPPDVVAEIGRRWVLPATRHVGLTLRLRDLAALVNSTGGCVGAGGRTGGGRGAGKGEGQRDDVHVFASVSPTMGVVRWRMCATDQLTVGRLTIRGCLGPDRFLCASYDWPHRCRFFVVDSSLGTTLSSSSSSSSATAAAATTLSTFRLRTEWIGRSGPELGCFSDMGGISRRAYCNTRWVVALGDGGLMTMPVVGGALKAVFCSETGNTVLLCCSDRVLLVDLELTHTLRKLAVLNEIVTQCRSCMFLEPSTIFTVHSNKLRMAAKNTATAEPGQIHKFINWPFRYIIGPEHFCVAGSSGVSVYHLSNLNTPIMTSVHACDAERSCNKPLTGRTGILPVLTEQTGNNTGRSNATATTTSLPPQQREQPQHYPHRVALVDVATGTRLAIITIPQPPPGSTKSKH